jgi:hypothetical protein
VRLWVPIAVVLLAASPRASADADRVEHARATVLDHSYQRELPAETTPPRGDQARHDGSGADRGSASEANRSDGDRGPDRGYDDEAPHPGPAGGILSFLMWGVIAVAVVLLAFWLTTELVKYGGDDLELAADPTSPAPLDFAVVDRPLDDADVLANEGRYSEAIHALLLRTLQELVRTSSVRVSPAHTSREILARVPLLTDSRDALSGLITAVELTFFGGDVASADDFARCRAQFQVFAAAFRAQGARA